MIISPIIPVWVMGIICVFLLFFISKNKFRKIRQILIIILLFVINLRIMIISDDVEVMSTNLDVLFVIDNTLSMMAEDYSGKSNRLEAIKDDCEYIVDELAGANFSIITFSNESQILTPYTKDMTITLNAIDTMKTMDSLYGRGTTLNVSLDNMETQLKKAEEKDSTRTKIVFYISDGEITAEDSSLDSFSGLKEYIDNGAVLGYGTESGGKMRYDEESTYYIIDFTQEWSDEALSKIDEDNLETIASDMGIDYIHMTKQANIKNKLKEIKRGAIEDLGEKSESNVDIYYLFVIPLAGLLIYEFITYKKKM